MDDVLKIVILIGAMVGLGVGTYAGVTVISILKRRFEGHPQGPGPEELEALHARLANVEGLEARLNELEERVDFAERLITHQQDAVQLPAGQPQGHQ